MPFRDKKALLISVAAHAALLCALVWGALHFRAVELAGPGDAVSVWITAGGGTPAGQQAPGPIAKPAVKAEPRAAIENKSPSMGEASNVSQSASDGSGGQGPGIGTASSGAGGNPVLAAIWKRINASKYYPNSARRRGIAGAPRVTFEINSDGSINWVKLAASCGESDLDDAALKTVRLAAPLPYYAGPITVAVRYTLQK